MILRCSDLVISDHQASDLVIRGNLVAIWWQSGGNLVAICQIWRPPVSDRGSLVSDRGLPVSDRGLLVSDRGLLSWIPGSLSQIRGSLAR